MFQILGALVDVIGHCVDWLGLVMTGTGMTPVWLGCVLMWTVYRVMLKPLFGIATSDMAMRNYGKYRSFRRSNRSISAARSYNGE